MTFEQAERKLLRLAKGKHCSLYYSRTLFEKYKSEKQDRKQECSLYVAGFGIYEGHNWKAAFDKLKLAMFPPPMPTDEAPVDEIVTEGGTND